MTEQHESYRVSSADVNAIIAQLNQIFNLIANRLDQIEGLRGTPTVYRSDIEYPGQDITGALTAASDGVSADFGEPITLTFANDGLHIVDTNASHDLIISPGSDLTADRTFKITTGDSNRTITLTGDPTLADWFNQAVKTTSSPTFAALTRVGGATNKLVVAADGSISLAGTARIDWTKIAANGVTLGDGPPTSSDTVADLQTAHDGNTYTIDEDSASAGQNLIVDFTGVTAFNWVQILGYYDGQTSHHLEIQLEVTPFDDSTWHTFHVMYPDGAYQENYSFFVPDDSAYINSGVVKIRFLHSDSGNSSDDWVFDVVALYQ